MKIDKSIKPEIAHVFYDEYEEKGLKLFNDYMDGKENSSPDLLLKASEEFGKTSNPDGIKMSTLSKGLYFFKKGESEKDQIKAKKLFLKAMTAFRKIDPKDIMVKRAEAHYLKSKFSSDEGLKKEPDLKSLLRKAELSKELGKTKDYHIEMSLYYMFLATHNISALPKEEILKNATLMLKHAKLGSNPDILYKVQGLYHQMRAGVLPRSKQTLEEFEKAITAIKKTSDRFGEETAVTEFMMTKAMLTGDEAKRNKLLKVVAERYKKSGQPKKEDFVRKLLSPLPIKSARVVFLCDQSLEKIKVLEKKINDNKGQQKGPFTIFYHLSYMIERLKDIKRIMLRMAITRKQITSLHILENSIRPQKIKPGKPYPKTLNNLLNRISELTEQMKQDMESLYIYGNLLLDQWSYLIGYIAGYEVPERTRREGELSFRNFADLFADENTKKELKNFWKTHKGEVPEGHEMNFLGLLSLLQSKDYKGELSDFWTTHKKDIIWLNFHLRFFRNVFIEHLRKPWQRGNTMGVYTDDFNLHIPAAVGFIKPEKEKKILEEIYPLSPQRLRDMPDDYWEKKNLKRVLEVTLYFIDELENQNDREKVWKAWDTIGGSTPSYDVIGGRLLNYIYGSLDTIINFIDKQPNLLKLGKF